MPEINLGGTNMHKKIAKNLTSFITAFIFIISTGSYSVFGEEY